MHLLAISLLSIFAGTMLLAKTKKEELGKFFTYISWFFVVVGFLVFIGFIAGGICKMSHCCKSGQTECSHGMMMKDCKASGHSGMTCAPGMCKGACCDMAKCCPEDGAMKCSPGMCKGACGDKAKCCPEAGTKECCPEQKESDSTKMPVPQNK